MIETDQSLGLLTYFFPTDLTWGFLVEGFHWCVNHAECVAIYNSDSCHCADRVTVCVCTGTILIFNVFLNANNALKSETLNNTHTHTKIANKLHRHLHAQSIHKASYGQNYNHSLSTDVHPLLPDHNFFRRSPLI